MNRGEIWWVDLGPARGSGPAYDRPCVVVQSDAFNRSALHTVLIVPLTSNLRLGKAVGNVVLPTSATGLPKESVANVSQLTSVDKGLLRDPCGRIGGKWLEEIEKGLRKVLALGG